MAARLPKGTAAWKVPLGSPGVIATDLLPAAGAAGDSEGQQELQQGAAAAAEAFVLSFLRTLARAAHEPADLPPSVRTAVVAVLSDPCHALVAEDGGFCAATGREQRLLLVRKNYRRLARLFGALDAAHRLSATGRTATQRELFYIASSSGYGRLFRKQPDMDRAVRDVVGALRIGRPHLGIMTTEKGIIAGAISFLDPKNATSWSVDRRASAVPITEAMLGFGDDCIELGAAHCVLVVEKDSFFQNLLQGRLLDSLPLVLVTGRGYPDMLTRRLLQRIRRKAPQLPQVFLGDYDPHGVSIFLVYLASVPAMRWLGMHGAHVQDLPAEVSLPFTARDGALRASLLRRPEVRGNERYAEQVAAMDRKFELEALHAALGPDEVALHFVPEKILRHAWI